MAANISTNWGIRHYFCRLEQFFLTRTSWRDWWGILICEILLVAGIFSELSVLFILSLLAIFITLYWRIDSWLIIRLGLTILSLTPCIQIIGFTRISLSMSAAAENIGTFGIGLLLAGSLRYILALITQRQNASVLIKEM